MEKTVSAAKSLATSVAQKWSEEIPPGGFGAVIAHAGIGKTAFLVQLALAQMLRGGQVLHISLNDPLKKVDLWYQEMFHNLQGREASKIPEQWAELLSRRFIMIFQAARFTAPRLEERLTELVEQKIFSPDLLLIDGLHFEKSLRATLEELRELALRYHLKIWFTVHSHRNESPLPNGMPPGFGTLADLFSLVWQIKQEGSTLSLQVLKGAGLAKELFLDPTTMFIRE